MKEDGTFDSSSIMVHGKACTGFDSTFRLIFVVVTEHYF